jgi:hypothetical protein
MRRPVSCLPFCLNFILLAYLCCASAYAQEFRGKIDGRVTDASGAAVPGVEIKATNTQTGVAIGATTNAVGNFDIPYLSPGTYDLSAERAGFKKYLRSGIELQVDGDLTFEIRLEIGQVNQSITVTGAASLLETSPSFGMVADNKRITDLPLTGSSAFTVAYWTPGVTYLGPANHPTLAPAVENVSAFNVDGLPEYSTEFSIDGGVAMWTYYPAFQPPADDIAEFKAETTRFDASTRAPGGNVNVALRSGTNRLHGSLSEKWSDQKFQALNLFNRQALAGGANIANVRTPFVFNMFGGTVNGPLVLPKIYDGRDKTFWSYGFEGLDRPTFNASATYTVPTVPERQGNFSALLALGSQYQIYDPTTTVPAAGGLFSRSPISGNIITAPLNATAVKLLSYWPLPNVAGLANAENNFVYASPTYNWYVSHTVRVEHNLSAKQRIFGRYDQSHNLFNSGISMPTPADGSHRNRYQHGFGFDDTYVINPQFLVNFHYTLSRFAQTFEPYPQGFNLATAGFSSNLVSILDPAGITFPVLTFGSYTGLGNTYASGTYTTYNIWAVDFGRISGKHNIHFGGEYRLNRASATNETDNTPTMAFGTTYTNGPLNTAAAAPIGQDLTSFLYGIPTGGTGTINASYAEQNHYLAGFIQDTFKVSPRLTLDLGLRYEYETAPTERYNRTILGFNFTAANPIQAQAQANYALNPIPEVPASSFQVPGGLTYAGVNGNPRTLWNPDEANFAPRVGMAYRLPHSSVLRLGYGLFYFPDGVDWNQGLIQSGFTASTALVPSLNNGQTFVATLQNPFPNGYLQPTGASQGLSTFLGNAVSFNSPLPHPYAQRFNASLQKQVFDWLFEVAYDGTEASRLGVSKSWDYVPAQYLSTTGVRNQTVINTLSAAVPNPFYPSLPGTGLAGATTSVGQLLMPFPEFTGVTSTIQTGYSWYHALDVSAERRMGKGFTVQANWTWSRWMQATTYLNAVDAGPYYQIAPNDVSQRFAASGIYELPFGTGRKLASTWSRLPNYLVSGWQLAAKYQGQGGLPLAWGNVLFTGTDLHQIELPLSQRSPGEWFNTSVFATASNQQLADNIRTFPTYLSCVRGQGLNDWDVSVLRNFRINESLRFQLRAEAVDATGHTFYASPNMTPTSTAFGKITTTSGGYPRQIYFMGKLLW